MKPKPHLSITCHVCNFTCLQYVINGISGMSWSAFMLAYHPPLVCTEKGDRWAEICRDKEREVEREGLCWQIYKKGKKRHNAAAESWKPPPEVPQPIAVKPGCSLYPDAAEILRSTHVRLFFSRHSFHLPKTLVQSRREWVSMWRLKGCVTHSPMCSITVANCCNVTHRYLGSRTHILHTQATSKS